MKKVLALLVIIIAVFAGVNFGTKAGSGKQNGNVLQEPMVNNSAKNEFVERNEAQVVGIPQTITIPRINVKAHIESVGQDVQKRMDIPKNSDNAAWYNLGPRPGMIGSAVIAGHKDKADGSPSVFWDIKKLVPGDKIIITDANGKELSFSVVGKEDYPDADFPLQKVFATTGDRPLLNLITCDGVWNKTERNYSQRIVVSAEQDV